MEALTKRQQEIFDYITSLQRMGAVPPSMREIAQHFGFRSINAVQDHLKALRRKGALEHAPFRARSIRTPQTAHVQIVDIPLYGTIPAGFAEGADPEAEGCISVDIDTLNIRPTVRTFALRVRGDSMTGRHILDGDIVVCEHGLTPRPGDVVAALIDNESTLKTFVIERRRAFLKAENPDYPNLMPASELVIQGVVITVIRQCR